MLIAAAAMLRYDAAARHDAAMLITPCLMPLAITAYDAAAADAATPAAATLIRRRCYGAIRRCR